MIPKGVTHLLRSTNIDWSCENYVGEDVANKVSILIINKKLYVK